MKRSPIRNSNKGIVNVNDAPYIELTKAMRELNRQADRLIEFFDGQRILDDDES